MTADEVAFAGGLAYQKLSSPYAWYYLNSTGGSITGSGRWWLMSPAFWRSNDLDSYEYDVLDNGDPGYLRSSTVFASDAVRPVVSIDLCAKVTGSGTVTDPYVIDETNSTC